MPNNIKLIVFPIKDAQKAKTFFNAFLGAKPYADSPYYIGYKVGDIEIGLDPNGQAVVSYIDATDINARIKELEAAGGTVQMQPKDVGGGLLVAQITDADGNVLGLRQPVK